MINFTRAWVNRQMQGLWEEMVGIRPTLPSRTQGQQPPAQASGAVDLQYARQWIPFSELRAARLIRMQLEDRLTFAGEESKGEWYFWNDVYHEQETSGVIGDWVSEAFTDQIVAAMNAIEPVIEADIQAQVAAGANEATLRKQSALRWREHRDYQRKLHSDAGLNALKSRLRKQCTKPAAYFDDDRRWLVCKNGVIDLEGFRKFPVVSDNFRPHSPERPVTRSVDCEFNSKAEAPNWYHFLETSIPDEEVRAFLQRLVGAAFLGESKVKAIPNLQGPKDCGKTIFVNTLERLAGGYGVQPSPDSLMQTPGGTNFEQETLRGARFVGISEPSVSKKLDDTFCKQITGGDEVRTRTLNRASRPWLPQCVIFIASNHAVNFNTNDAAFVERLCLVEFPHQFFDPNEAPAGDWHIKDYQLEEKLAGESEGIFLWVIRGMWEYLQHGIAKPDSVKRAGDRFVVDNSGPLSWVAEKVDEGLLEVVSDPWAHSMTDYATLKNLYGAYAQDFAMDGEKPLGKHAFSRHLEGKYGKTRSGATRILGVKGSGRWSNFNSEAPQLNL